MQEFIMLDALRRMEEAFTEIRMLVEDAQNKVLEFDNNLKESAYPCVIDCAELQERNNFVNNICVIVSEVEKALALATAFGYVKSNRE